MESCKLYDYLERVFKSYITINKGQTIKTATHYDS